MKLFLVGVFLIALIILITYFWLFTPIARTGTLSNITEVYTLFTPYMEDFVDSYLNVMSCQPSQYYYTNSSKLCFVCGKFDICYGYAMVKRNGSELMNPNDLFLAGYYTKENLLNLYSYGVGNTMNCKCSNDDCFCDDNVKAVIKDFDDVFIFQSDLSLENNVISIAAKMGKDECETLYEGALIICGDLAAKKIKNNEVSFGRW
jgi:hypothetical protein